MPLVVLVHGGFWRHQWTLDTTESIAVDLARRGVATLNIEYRRIGAGGSATTMVEDVREAITTALDDERLDPLRWAIAGHSAGGQLAIAAVADMDAAPPRLTTTMGGVSDLAHGLSADLGEGAVAAYLGDEPPQAASPVDLAPLRGRLLIAHGTKDDIVPFEQAERLIGAQRAAGGRVDLHSGAHGHFEYLDPSSDVWQKLAVTMLEAVSG